MSVSDGEKRSLHADREVEACSGTEMLGVEVAAPARGGHDRMLTRFGRRDANGAGKRPVPELDRVAPDYARPLSVDLRDPEPRLRELVREQAEARNQRRPAPILRSELDDLDLEYVARRGTLDEHGTADRVDVGEVELLHVCGARGRGDLLVRGVAHMEFDKVARVDLERTLERVVPGVVEGVAAKVMERSRAAGRVVHRASLTHPRL